VSTFLFSYGQPHLRRQNK
jgi:hypothetical protein